MRLSKLQQYILGRCYDNNSGSARKNEFFGFYPEDYLIKNKKIVQDSIHKCVESLVTKDLLIAYGRRTAKKWFIEKAKITPKGKRRIRELIKNRQIKLPIK